jgi:hypothetical protein
MLKTVLLLIFYMSFHWTIGQTPTCTPGVSSIFIETENIRARLMNQGDMFWDPGLSVARYNWPKSTGTKHILFASSLWFGAIDSATNQIITTVQTYRQSLRNYWPGPLVTGQTQATNQQVCNVWDRHFLITRISLDSHLLALQTNPLPIPESIIPKQVKNWPGKSNLFLKQEATNFGLSNLSSFDQDLAPFIDVNGNGIYDPQLGDLPDLGNKSSMVWWVMNDAGNSKNYIENTTLVPPVFLEFQVMAYGYAKTENQTYLDNTLFVEWKAINKGTRKLIDSYFSIWADPDIGNGGDDFVLCHPLKNLGIAYNGDDLDEGVNGYGNNPPAVALKIIDAPGPLAENDGHDNNRNGLIDEQGEKSIFNGFVYYNVGGNPRNGDPTKYTDFYFYMTNRWKDASDISFGGSGLGPVSSTNPKAKFMFPGANDPFGFSIGGTVQNPVTLPTIWREDSLNLPGDRRFLMNSGPFTLRPNEEATTKFAILIGYGGTRLQNVSHLYSISDSLEQYYPFLSSSQLLNQNTQSDFKIFPNPATGSFQIQTPSNPKSIFIVDLQGRLIYGLRDISETKHFYIEQLPKGLYCVKVQFSNHVSVQKLWIK